MAIIRIENVGKRYILKHEKGAFIKDVLPRLFIPKEKEEIWALKNISLIISEGESLGIIGRNGAGKSTLLNIIAGISFPIEGRVEVKGRISTLLTLGAGFHPELTGIDNIYLNGVILGMRIKEIKSRLNKIIDFSELGDFIKQPLYTYSSGMILRLGFSIAVHTDFDILLIDEIISVGDLPFQEKCIKKINEFKKQGKTLVIASQSLDLVKSLCDRALLLEKGRMFSLAEPERVIDKYLEIIKEKREEKEGKGRYPFFPKYPEDIERIKTGWETRQGTGEVKILEVRLRDRKGKEKNIFQTGENLKVEVKYIVEKEIEEPHFGVAIFREDYLYLYGPNTEFDGIKIKSLKRGVGSFVIEYRNLILGSGDYRLSVAIWDKEEKNPYAYHYAYYRFKIGNEKRGNGSLIDIPNQLFINGEGAKRDTSSLSSLFNISNRKFGSQNFVSLKEIKSLGKWRREEERFWLNESLRFLIKLKILRRIDLPLICVRLYSEDNLLIHDSYFKIKESLVPGDYRLNIFYPKIPLLRGDYFLALGIFSKKNLEEFQYLPSLIKVNFQSSKKDHGIIYLPHRWRLKNP